MRLVRIGVGAVSVKVGDFAGNAGRLRAVTEAAVDQDVDLLVTPELALSGYSLEDRVWWPDIARRSWDALEGLAPASSQIAVFVGLLVGLAVFAAAQAARGDLDRMRATDLLGEVLRSDYRGRRAVADGRAHEAR